MVNLLIEKNKLVLTLSLTGWGTQDKPLLSVLQPPFPHLQNTHNYNTDLIDLWGRFSEIISKRFQHNVWHTIMLNIQLLLRILFFHLLICFLKDLAITLRTLFLLIKMQMGDGKITYLAIKIFLLHFFAHPSYSASAVQNKIWFLQCLTDHCTQCLMKH